jgi:hypothetical protein
MSELWYVGLWCGLWCGLLGYIWGRNDERREHKKTDQ